MVGAMLSVVHFQGEDINSDYARILFLTVEVDPRAKKEMDKFLATYVAVYVCTSLEAIKKHFGIKSIGTLVVAPPLVSKLADVMVGLLVREDLIHF